MAKVIVMPKLGLTMREGVIAKWLKAEGDPVANGEDLFDVETEKLTNTIAANADGVLRKILVKEGEKKECFTPVAIIAGADEDISDALAESGAPTEEKAAPAADRSEAPAAPQADKEGRVICTPAAKKLAAELGIDYRDVSGTGPNGRIMLRDVRAYQPPVRTEQAPAEEPRATSLAKKMAEDKGIDLSQVPGHGRVTARDVMTFANGTLEAAAAPSVPAETKLPMTGMRRVIAQRMSESQAISPTVTFDISVDMTQMKAAKGQLASVGMKVSYTDLLVKFVTRALLKYPMLNCSVGEDEFILHNYVNMGIAVALPDGLLVPVVRNAQELSVEEISAEVKRLAADAKAGKLGPDALQGGTFTISNLGMYGIESFTPIINQPEVAILGVNTMTDTPVVENGEVVIRPLMKLSLTTDHRAVDGAVAAEFLAYLKKILEKPAVIW